MYPQTYSNVFNLHLYTFLFLQSLLDSFLDLLHIFIQFSVFLKLFQIFQDPAMFYHLFFKDYFFFKVCVHHTCV